MPHTCMIKALTPGSRCPAHFAAPVRRRRGRLFLLRFGLALAYAGSLLAGGAAAFGQAKPDADKDAKIAELKKQKEQAIEAVKKIINQPVPRYARPPGISVNVSSPGWFHDGAIKPEFNTVDVRQSRETPYAAHPYVTSDLNPGVVWRGTDLEFNSMTKYFYIDRTVPKKKLTEAEMVEVNRLYRIIGKCETDIAALIMPPEEKVDATAAAGTAETDTETVVMVRQPMPRENYVKAAIGVSIVLGLYVVYRLCRR